MTIEIVDFPIENGGSFHSYVSLPEGNHQHHNRVYCSVLQLRLVFLKLLIMS